MSAGQDPSAGPSGEQYTFNEVNAIERYTSPIITVYVGAISTAFHIHQELAMRHSKYGYWRSKTTTMKNVGLQVFAMFVDWLYKQNLTSIGDWDKVYGAVPDSSPEDRILDAYLFAHNYEVTGLKIALLELAVTYFTERVPTRLTIAKAFGQLPDSSPFLDLIVDAFCINGLPGDLDKADGFGANPFSTDWVEFGSNLPPKFLVRVTKKYADIAKDTVKSMNLRNADYRREAEIEGERPAKRKVRCARQ